ncbi:unnamed protein product, partial [Allacma fusca]
NDCGNNCEIEIPRLPGLVNRYSQSATLYAQEDFQGKFIKINSATNIECFNLDYHDILLYRNFHSSFGLGQQNLPPRVKTMRFERQDFIDKFL